jgi:hypothetical protein
VYVLITSLVPVDWRPGHQLVHWRDGKPVPYSHPCNPLRSTELLAARKEAWDLDVAYGSHMTNGIAICREVLDAEDRLYIFECPSVSIAPKQPYQEPIRKPPQKKA